jgi:DNA-binding NtrC family response regulator
MSAAAKRLPEPSPEFPSVLVVEDEILIRIALADSLQDCGIKVLEAGNALDAIRILEADGTIELVFSDISMPGGMDGTALAQWVHAHRPGVPVLLTSGNRPSSQNSALEFANEQFFAKPYNMPSVIACIRDAVGARRG